MANRKELEALIVLAGKVDPSLQKALRTAQNDSTKTANNMSKLVTASNKFFGSIAKVGVVVGGAAAAGFAIVAKEGLQLASDLVEVQNVVDTTFGGSASKINSWAQSAKNSFGLSELQAKQFNGTLGAMLKSSGITGNSLITMSENMSGLAGDLSSFYNLSQDDAFEKIRSGISGETEPLKQLGINMSVANLQAFALSKGIKTSYQSMDQASQTALRYAYLMDVSKDAQGDFEKTQGGFANQTRLLKTNFQELAAKIMTNVLPGLTSLAQKANDVMDSIASNPAALQKTQDVVKGVADKIGDVIKFAGQAYDFIKGNWSTIEPIIWGIVGAITAWRAITIGMMVYQGIMAAIKAGTIAAAIAQWGLNAAVWANPMTWIVLAVAAAIGILVAGIYLLWKNWDKVSAFIVGIWQNNVLPFFTGVAGWFTGVWTGITDGFKNAWSGIIGWFSGLWDGIINVVKGYLNIYVGIFNFLIRGLNKIQFDVPDWVPLIGGKHIGINIAEIPAFAQGGFTNRPAVFGEAGLEAAIPIKYKNPRSISLLNRASKAIGAGSSNGKPEVHIHFDFSGPINKPKDVVDGVVMAKEKIFEIIDEYFDDDGRYSFG